MCCERHEAIVFVLDMAMMMGLFFLGTLLLFIVRRKKGKANILSENGEKASDDEWLELTYLDIYECVCVFFFLFFVNWSTYAKCFIKEGSLK